MSKKINEIDKLLRALNRPSSWRTDLERRAIAAIESLTASNAKLAADLAAAHSNALNLVASRAGVATGHGDTLEEMADAIIAEIRADAARAADAREERGE